MDEAQFDMFARALHRSRRTLFGGLVGFSALGLAGAVDAKKKKKGKKKKKKKGGSGAPDARCVGVLEPCKSDSQCCPGTYNPSQGVCRVIIASIPGTDWPTSGPTQCCIPHHGPVDFYNTMCCGRALEEIEDGSSRCCIFTGLSDDGHPEHCCKEYPSIDGVCCLAATFKCEVNGKKLPCCSGVCGPDGRCT